MRPYIAAYNNLCSGDIPNRKRKHIHSTKKASVIGPYQHLLDSTSYQAESVAIQRGGSATSRNGEVPACISASHVLYCTDLSISVLPE